MTVLAPTSTYRLARPYTVRILGVAAVAAGSILLVAVAGRALHWPAPVAGALLVAAAVLGLVMVLAALAVLRPPILLRMDAVGFSVRWPGGRGVLRADWEDVDDVTSERPAGQPLALLRHRDGQSTSLLLGMLDAPARDVEGDLRGRLNAAYGYRPLRHRDVG